jgi:hypothetical protein
MSRNLTPLETWRIVFLMTGAAVAAGAALILARYLLAHG